MQDHHIGHCLQWDAPAIAPKSLDEHHVQTSKKQARLMKPDFLWGAVQPAKSQRRSRIWALWLQPLELHLRGRTVRLCLLAHKSTLTNLLLLEATIHVVRRKILVRGKVVRGRSENAGAPGWVSQTHDTEEQRGQVCMLSQGCSC